MTIKVYKKIKLWYYTYHNKEYVFNHSYFMDGLESLYGKNVFYFKIKFSPDRDSSKMAIVDYWGHYRMTSLLCGLTLVMTRCYPDNLIRFSEDILDVLDRNNIYIEDIK